MLRGLDEPLDDYPRITKLLDKYKKGSKLTDGELSLLMQAKMCNAFDTLSANTQKMSGYLNDIHDFTNTLKPLLVDWINKAKEKKTD